jgi:3'(2'), 5'-bisphosphate nucleotidase
MDWPARTGPLQAAASECPLNDRHFSRETDTTARLFGQIALRAGDAIMKVRDARHRPETKSDGSPVTAADLAADEVIREALAHDLPGLAVITEETCTAASTVDADCFALVDPLDGTREFINGSDEFTVNIALIAHGVPIAGAVYAPALHRLYIGGTRAHRLDARRPRAGMRSPAARISIPTPNDGSNSIASRNCAMPARR